MAKKLLNLRIFDDDSEKPWSKNVIEKDFEVLCVSQFTLCHVLKGNKPDFHQAMDADKSGPMYQEFLDLLSKQYKPEKIKGLLPHMLIFLEPIKIFVYYRRPVSGIHASSHTE